MIIKNKVKNCKCIPIDKIKDFQGNLKKLDETNLNKLKSNIKNNGFIAPVFVWEDKIVDGHTRLIALRELLKEGNTFETDKGLGPEIPIVEISAENSKEASKFVLSYNSQFGKITDTGFKEFYIEHELDLEELKSEVDLDLDIDFFDTEIKQDSEEEINVEEDEYVVVDAYERLKNKTKIKEGDIFKLGDHLVMCGDSTKTEDVSILIQDEKITGVFTDPPYGINLNGDNSKRGKETSLMKGGLKLKSFKDDSISYAVDAFNIVQKLNINKQVWFGANYYAHHIPQTNNWLVWDKRVEEKMTNTNSDCELAWVLDGHSSVRIFRHLWNGLIKASENKEKRVHPTQKPIALADWCFRRYDMGDTILDLFGGSGSTLIACEQLGRKCRMMELDPVYVQVIIDRWEKYTGMVAEKL